MKFSYYNTIITLPSGNALMYNSLVDRYIILDKHKKTIVSSNTDNPDAIRKIDPILHKQLFHNYFIVEDDFSESGEVDKLISKYDNDPDTFHLHINPTMDCICRCWYCYEDHLHNTKMGEDVIKSTMLFIKNVVKSNPNLRNFQLSFFGGEPLMHFGVVTQPIIEYASKLFAENDIRLVIHFTTNGVLINEKVLNTLRGKSVSFQITLDGDKDYHNQTRFLANGNGTYGYIIKNVNQILNDGHRIILRINYTHKNYISITNIINDLRLIPIQNRSKLSVDFQQVWQDRDTNDSNERLHNHIIEYTNIIKRLGYNTTSHLVYDSVRNSCYGNRKNYALINYNGDVFCCTARKFTTGNRAGTLTADGSIDWENNSQEKRMNSRFKKTVCRHCRIAPLCGGGCSQHCLEDKSTDSQCSYGYTDYDLDKIIMNRFEYMFIENND